MRKRRFAQLSSDDDDDKKPSTAVARNRKKKLRQDSGDEEEDKKLSEDEEEEDVAEEELEAKPIGDVVKVSGKGKKRKKHYASFEYDGNVFELEDPVLLTPAEANEKPYVAIIKDITESDGSLMVTGQWFYRPEEAEKKGGGYWQARDTRELFYSFHLDNVPAESVMHKCVVHFVPLNKKLPLRSEHPGFIIQKVYDTVEKKLWKLTDKDYEDNKQHEIDLLVQKTKKRLGELPDIEPEDAPADHHDQLASKWNLRRKPMAPIDVSRGDVTNIKSDNPIRTETPMSCTNDASEYHAILAKFKALTGVGYRDRWLDRLLQDVQLACKSMEEDKSKGGDAALDNVADASGKVEALMDSKEKGIDAGESLWPDAAVSAITALENASHEAFASDFSKYNQKMRSLDFNLKNNALLARRLLNKELDPVVIINMSPNELKDGLTANEKTTKEPEVSERMQMTDARCSRCMEKKVGVADIIHAGGHGDRYQLECIACGHTWYASRDAISSLTIDAPNVAGNVGTAPWATAKFEEVEKKLVSPREPAEKASPDIFQKSTAPYMPVLEKQKSMSRSKTEDPSAPPSANRE